MLIVPGQHKCCREKCMNSTSARRYTQLQHEVSVELVLNPAALYLLNVGRR